MNISQLIRVKNIIRWCLEQLEGNCTIDQNTQISMKLNRALGILEGLVDLDKEY